MMQWNLVILFIFITSFKCFYAYPGGAPGGSCQAMTPYHGQFQPQSSSPPFHIIAKNSGNSIEVIVKDARGQIPIRGVLLKAFHESGSEVNGEFVSDESTQPLKCLDGDKSALTHNSNVDKQRIRTLWKPLQPVNGKVFFRATVVQNYATFWLGVESSKISVQFSEEEGNRRKTSSTPAPQIDSNIYSGCGVTKGCFGQPDGCVGTSSCEVILTFRKESSSFRFQLAAALGSRDNWVAMGFSNDIKMGNDSVVECMNHNNRVLLRESWNYDQPRKGNRLLRRRSYINGEENEYTDGTISCSWTLPPVFDSDEEDFYLNNETYYLLLAKGPVNQDGSKFIHSERWVSVQKVDLSSVIIVQSRKSILIKLHGVFMTIAWVGLVSIAIFGARHYKEVWPKSTICGVKVWFAVHRSFMLLSVAMIIIAFIVVFVEVGGWSQTGSNPHPLLGCIATALGCLQPFIALLRCAPDHPKRPIFRWTHTLVGYSGHIFAAANLFLAVGLHNAKIPQAFSWVLITFIIFHIAMILLLHIHATLMERERKREVHTTHSNHLQFADSYTVNKSDGAGSAFKKFALLLYCVVTIGITLALVLMIVLN